MLLFAKGGPVSADDLHIDHHEADKRGAFFISREGVRLAEMTYSRVSDTLVIIDHTGVEAALQGKGVARRLLDQAVSWARANGQKIAATCPYALSQFKKDPSIRDVYNG